MDTKWTIKTRIKSPIFGGKTFQLSNYSKELEVASKTNCWTQHDKALAVALRSEAMDVLQTLPEDEMEKHYSLVEKTEVRY